MPTQNQVNNYIARSLSVYLSGTPDSDPLPAGLANLVIAQDRYETADYSSDVFNQDNNLGGYTYTGSKWQAGPGLAKPGGGNYAHYTTLENSAGEKVDYIYRRVADGSFPADLTTITTPGQYAQLLKGAGYYGDTLTNYTNGLVRWFQDLTGEAVTAVRNNPGLPLLGILALVFAGIFFSKKAK